MTKEIVSGMAFRNRLLSGVTLLADTVKDAMGPYGRNIMWQRGQTILSGDMTNITELKSEDPVENMGIQVLGEACKRTYVQAGNGGRVTALLAQYILQEGLRNTAAGADALALKRGLQEAAQVGVAAINRLSQPISSSKEAAQAASAAAGDTAIGQIIADALEQVGPAGTVTVESSGSVETICDLRMGLHYEKGWLSSEMATDEAKTAAELHQARILITDQKITHARIIAPLLEQAAATGTPLLIIADSVEGDALSTLILNIRRKILKAAAVHPPAYGNGRRARLEDIAIAVGGVFFSEQSAFRVEEATWDLLGAADSVHIDRHNTVIMGSAGNHEEIVQRVNSLRTLLQKTDFEFDRQQLKERIAQLSGGVAVIRVGGATEAEIKDKVSRAESALSTAKAALSHGIVPGGGTVFLRILPAVQAYVRSVSGDRATGGSILMNALEQPLRQIARNAGLDDTMFVHLVKQAEDNNAGLDAANSKVTDLIKAGIIDSATEASMSLQNAVSAAAMLLTAEAGVLSTTLEHNRK